MGWKIRLLGRDRDLILLGCIYTNEPKITFTDSYAFLESARFNEFDDPSSVREEGKSLMGCIRVSVLGEMDTDHPPAVDDVVIRPNGNPYLFHELNPSEPSDSISGVTAVTDTSTAIEIGYDCESIWQILESPEIPRQSLYIELPKQDEKSSELIQLIDNGYDWVNLYRVYEWIKDEINTNPSKKSWIPEDKENLFTRTSNSPKVLGHRARHANSIPDRAPDNPMSHREAIRLIHDISEEFLQERHSTV